MRPARSRFSKMLWPKQGMIQWCTIEGLSVVKKKRPFQDAYQNQIQKTTFWKLPAPRPPIRMLCFKKNTKHGNHQSTIFKTEMWKNRNVGDLLKKWMSTFFPEKKRPTHLQLSKCVDRTVPSHRIHRYMTWKPWHHPRCWRCCRKTAMSCWEANLMDLLRLPPRSLKVGFFCWRWAHVYIQKVEFDTE